MSHHAGVDAQSGSAEGSVKSYVIGFALSIIITIAAFVLVGKQLLSNEALFVVISILAVLQLYIQLVFFLHLNTSSEGRWNLMAFIFSLIVVLILVFGSMWIMYNLNYNMVH